MDRFAFIIFLRAGNQAAKMLRVNVVETMPFKMCIRDSYNGIESMRIRADKREDAHDQL